MEFIFQLLFEFLLQFLIEGAFDLMFGRLGADRPLLRFFMFVLVGAIVGGISLLVSREHLIANRSLRFAAVIFVPILIGFLMARIGKLRQKRGRDPNSLEHFFSAWGFAFALGAIRVGFAK